jgi:aldose 1-epimerase
MEVWCDQPGVQFYAGNFVDARGTGKGGATYGKRGGLCLETQHFPDAVNQPNFRTCVLRPGETYSHSMTHKFFAE